MRTKFIAFRTASETAAEAERAEQYLKAAQFWRKAYQLAPSTPDEGRLVLCTCRSLF